MARASSRRIFRRSSRSVSSSGRSSNGLSPRPLTGLPFVGADPLYARPRQELVAVEVPAGVSDLEEQAAPVAVAHVARQVVADPGRDRDEAPPAKETGDLRRPFPYPSVVPRALAAHRASSRLWPSVQQVTAPAGGPGPRASPRSHG